MKLEKTKTYQRCFRISCHGMGISLSVPMKYMGKRKTGSVTNVLNHFQSGYVSFDLEF